MGKWKSKSVHLISGKEEGLRWELKIAFSTNQNNWEGYFWLGEEKRKSRSRSKTIHLLAGSVEGFQWALKFAVSTKQKNWNANFTLADEQRRYRGCRRADDKYFAKKTFPLEWKQQFEIHHDWNRGETCYFLTPEEHHDLHHVTKR